MNIYPTARPGSAALPGAVRCRSESFQVIALLKTAHPALRILEEPSKPWLQRPEIASRDMRRL
jgi:hypothetical protein